MSTRKILGAAAVATAALGVTVGVAAHSAGASTPPCAAANMRPHYAGSDGSSGSINDFWHLTNVGTSACTISGFPSVVNYGKYGNPLRTVVTHGDPGPAVTLAPGAFAVTILSYRQPSITGCTPEAPARLTIGWSGTTYPLITARGEPACGGVLIAQRFSPG